MKSRITRTMVFVAVAVAISSCSQVSSDQATGNTVSAASKAAAEGAHFSSVSAQGQTQMTTLQKLLTAFDAQAGWDAYSDITGISWFDSKQSSSPEPDSNGSGTLYQRSGKMRLAGFSETDLPNGKVGADFDYVRGNEGESGVTLTGTAQSVDEIAVTKFYPDTDYAAVLARQFDGAVRIEAITTDCPIAYASRTDEQNTEKNAFYRLSLPSGELLYAEGSVIEDAGKYSPGNTVYRFYRNKPVQRMEAMHCQEAKP